MTKQLLNSKKLGAGRRQFLRSSLGAAGLTAALPALQGLGVLQNTGRAYAAPGAGYGPISPKADLRDGAHRLALPNGFQYRSFGVTGEPMSDGKLTPIAMDGMACFNGSDGNFRLVRNHEDRNLPDQGTIPSDPTYGYDPKGGGGTTTLVVDPHTRDLITDFVSISGTIVNCAGGATPWGSWITCEETNAGVPQNWGKQHGYCFEVPADANGETLAVPLVEMGRFSHEAIAVDPATGIVYETEDAGADSGFFRYIPNVPGVLGLGGRLQMLKIVAQDNYNTNSGQTVGVPLQVEWVDIADPDPAGTSTKAVANQGLALGAAMFGRLEGCWYGSGAIYFVSTSGGDAGRGQVWEYRPNGVGGVLTLIFESPGSTVLDSPDNLCVTPNGGLMLCEDGGGQQYLRGLTLAGEIFDFGLNLINTSEFAGATFGVAEPSATGGGNRGRGRGPQATGGPDDRITLFVNTQGETRSTTPPQPGDDLGMTFAIWGPWSKGAL
jgi:secreted PhoX family phosphatase